jgi:two-component system, OmpR family, sensor kinase
VRGAERRRGLGLRWRLAAWVAVVLIASSAITFVAVYRGTGSQLRHQIDGEVAGDADELGNAVASTRTHSAKALERAAADYIQAQPFSASSTLLFVIVPGGGTATNRPELFSSQRPDDGESATEQNEENLQAERLLKARSGYSTVEMPDIGQMRLLRRTVHVAGPIPRVSIGVGEPLASVSRAQDGVSRAFILAGILSLVGALLAALLIGTRLSEPLRRMAGVAAEVDAGELHHRIHETDRGAPEVQVLAESFNRMLDRLAEAFAGQRAFVADASHELRTPLTVIRGQLEVLAAQSDPSPQEVARVETVVGAEVSRISRLVDDLLLLARSEQTEFLRAEEFPLEEFVTELWDGYTLTGEERRFELGPLPAGSLSADPDRLAQALRNLIGNAIVHTAPETGRVLLQVEPAGSGSVRFVVQDDGPGISEAERELVFDRFHRTDSARDRASGGTGLGLAIVRAIAEAHGGRVRAASAPVGGARLELEIPGFSPARQRTSSNAADGLAISPAPDRVVAGNERGAPTGTPGSDPDTTG